MSAALLGVALICCSSSAAGAGAFFGGFIPGYVTICIAKKMKKIIQLIITGDAKPIDCENLYKYMKETKGTTCCGICQFNHYQKMKKLY